MGISERKCYSKSVEERAGGEQLQPQVLERCPKSKQSVFSLNMAIAYDDQFVDIEPRAEDSKFSGGQNDGFGICVLGSGDERFGEVLYKRAV